METDVPTDAAYTLTIHTTSGAQTLLADSQAALRSQLAARIPALAPCFSTFAPLDVPGSRIYALSDGRATELDLARGTAAAAFLAEHYDHVFQPEPRPALWHVIAPQTGPRGLPRYTGVDLVGGAAALIGDLMRSGAVEANPAVPSPAVLSGVLQLQAIQTVRRVRSDRGENVNLLFRRGWLLLSIEQEPQTSEQGVSLGTSTVYVVGHPERDAV
ncbi:hypothetical protein SE17_08695 [Kouleothrix aurantiaca]|uniref:Uncharacterized protein n=1 Tax=Kouleothrix aurantiaca TaxID=186479 RepID=A0A0P9HFR0_9CHLR|nr:hypothetical protein SE17_08695 [Kouleothrix aurantiaca]